MVVVDIVIVALFNYDVVFLFFFEFFLNNVIAEKKQKKQIY